MRLPNCVCVDAAQSMLDILCSTNVHYLLREGTWKVLFRARTLLLVRLLDVIPAWRQGLLTMTHSRRTYIHNNARMICRLSYMRA
jgi:hypothetical protein